jgi:hypothetical protein
VMTGGIRRRPRRLKQRRAPAPPADEPKDFADVFSEPGPSADHDLLLDGSADHDLLLDGDDEEASPAMFAEPTPGEPTPGEPAPDEPAPDEPTPDGPERSATERDSGD